MELSQINLDLMIGVTRQCNFACAHCLRGDAEKDSFNVEYLESFIIKNNIDHIDNLTLTGGEPFLRVDILHKILGTLKNFSITVNSYYIATNGSRFNKDSIEFILDLHNYCEDNDISCITVSNSPYHQEERARIGGLHVDQQYDNLADVIEWFDLYYIYEDDSIDFYGISLEDIKFSREKPEHYGSLLNEGRALDNGLGDRDITPESEILDDDIDDLYVRSFIYLNEIGNVVPDYCDFSFETQDNGDLKNVEDFNLLNHVEEFVKSNLKDLL